ncbi:hypothetical protein HPG69_018069 [Diceros bicornis minor]|uniref:Cytochrome P450 n=1 Tax=Diceros bicornis minor TaxID=77932 RepID=A0A7J7F7X0_DICBM|nr:hypothetical protein HPG69_018069 [Diceros bicornis minor]
MEINVLLLLALLTRLLLLARGFPKARGHLPPGPHPLPFLGNLLQMDRRGLLKSILRLQESYGDVFTVYLGPRPMVLLCGTEAIREALVGQAEAFSGRGKIAVVEQVVQGFGVVFANREHWKPLRRFSLATMRDFGMGKQSVEERIQEEAQCLLEEMRNTKIYKNLKEVNTFIAHSVEEHHKTLDPSNPRDIIDTYLLRMDKEKSDPNSEFHQQNLIFNTLAHFFAGTETTSTTLRCGFLLMLKYPHITGKRICLGEGIACTELFLFFTTILQNFSVVSSVAPEDINLTPRENGVFKLPLKYQISVLPHQGY